MQLKTLLIIIIPLSLSACKKYPDGGFANQTRKHLFGGDKVGASKIWKLKLYEVNGIDSTYLIQGAASVPDFYEKFVTFELTDKKFLCSNAKTFINTYGNCIDKNSHEITFGRGSIISRYDSTQFSIIDNKNYCSRNIFRPEIDIKSVAWAIILLDDKKFIITIHLKQSYKIILEH